MPLGCFGQPGVRLRRSVIHRRVRPDGVVVDAPAISQHARRSLTPCTMQARLTALRRCSGLRSLPKRYPSTPACQGSARRATASASRSHAPTPSDAALDRPEAHQFLAPAIVGLLCYQRLFAGLYCRLPMGDCYFNLPKQTHDLLRRMLLHSLQKSPLSYQFVSLNLGHRSPGVSGSSSSKFPPVHLTREFWFSTVEFLGAGHRRSDFRCASLEQRSYRRSRRSGP